jgi:ABC-type transport system involved in multi-copper enzyme maturation permease subunit
MLRTIVKREILEYLKSSKFLLGLGVTLVLTAGSTIINVQDYKSRTQEYLAAGQEMKGDAFNVRLYRPPQVLSIFVQGKDRTLGNSIEIAASSLPSRTTGYMGEWRSQHSRFISGFAVFDFTFIVRVVLSLFVIFIAYNTVAEEKSTGTLKLILANRVSRDQLLLGKFLGGGCVVIAALLASSLVSLIIMLSHSFVEFKAAEWVRFAILLGLSAIYLTVFYTMSLFVSVLINRPTASLMVLLQAWVFLVVIYPNLGIIAAKSLYGLPTEEQLVKQKAAVAQPYEAERNKVLEAFNQEMSAGKVNKELGVRLQELSAKPAELGHQIDEEFDRKLGHQVSLARTISGLSPAVLFDQAAETFAQTGMAQYDRFMQGVYRYWQKLVERTKLLYIDRDAFMKAPAIELQVSNQSVSEAVTATWLGLFVLAFLSLAFFALAYAAFLKKDIR